MDTQLAPQSIKRLPSDVVNGGLKSGANLFHSFQEFNIKSGHGLYFNTPEGITNILSRITRNNPSNINGKLGVLGGTNLFFLIDGA